MNEGKKGSVAILGSTSMIGKSLISRYIDDGYLVHAFVRTTQSVDSSHPSVRYHQLDLSSATNIEKFLDAHASEIDVDALVCLAADIRPSSLYSVTSDELLRALSVGTIGNYLFISRLGPRMVERGYGRIVIGSSIGVRFGGGNDSFAYALSRHATEFLPQTVRAWARSGVLTNVVRIGVTDTGIHDRFPERDWAKRIDMIPIGRAATVDEVADYIFWHGSDRNSFVTGQVLTISGGE